MAQLDDSRPGEDVGAALEPLLMEPGTAVLMFDVDGTLAPIVDRPEDAAVPASTRAALERLAQSFALVACVSGRRAGEVREIVGSQALTYVGNHGLERLDPGEQEVRLDEAALAGSPDVAGFVAEHAGEIEGAGIRIEDKGPITALHWRGASDEPAAEAEAERVEGLARERGIEPRPGRKVLELRPGAEVDKGTSVGLLVRETGARAALYAGDDRTDLDAFRALRALVEAGELEAAVCVGVSSGEAPEGLEELSDVLVEGVEGVDRVLAALGG